MLNPVAGQSPKLLDQLRRWIRDSRYSLRMERAYVYWARWYIRFHALRHPADMGAEEMRLFLSDLSTTMIYLHVLNHGGRGVVSPLDATRTN